MLGGRRLNKWGRSSWDQGWNSQKRLRTVANATQRNLGLRFETIWYSQKQKWRHNQMAWPIGSLKNVNTVRVFGLNIWCFYHI